MWVDMNSRIDTSFFVFHVEDLRIDQTNYHDIVLIPGSTVLISIYTVPNSENTSTIKKKPDTQYNYNYVYL